MILGSEGRLGVITEATIHVHRVPERAQDPRLPLPRLGGGPRRRCTTIAASDAAPSVTRVSDARETAVLLRHQEARRPRRQPHVRRAEAVPPAGARTSTSSRCACRSSASRARQSHVDDERKLVGKIVGRARRHRASARAPASSTTRRSSTPPTSATSCSTAARWPTCPRPSAPWSRLERALRRRRSRAAHGAFDEIGVKGWIMCHLSHSLPLRRLPVLHVRVQGGAGADAARRSTTW